MPIRRKNPTGPLILLEDAVRTHRGRRTHFLDEETGAALCGAGLPNREFPFGSVEYLEDKYYKKGKPKAVPLTCYRCLKLLYMDEKTRTDGNLIIREFYPTESTHEDEYLNKRWEHVMIPRGRPKNKTWEQWIDTTEPQELTTSEWIPGPDSARTQPARWRIPQEDIPEEEKEFALDAMPPQDLADSQYRQLPRLQAERGQRLKEARQERAYLLAYYDALEQGPPTTRRLYRRKGTPARKRKIAKGRFDIDAQYQRLKKQNER